MKKIIKKPSHHVFWLLFLLLTFLVSLGASWVILARANFAYPLLHDYSGIKENIEYYSPRSRIKPHFDQSTREERIQLFQGIVDSIQQQGKGLETLAYHLDSGQQIRLLTHAEVVHLTDVAILYDRLKVIIFGIFVLWLGFLVLIVRQKRVIPKVGVLLRYALVLPALMALVLVIGAESIFYWLHELVFPAGHQWFFYYEESLMSMMMKAPDLFAYIAAMLVVLALVITVVILWISKWFAYRQLLHQH